MSQTLDENLNIIAENEAIEIQLLDGDLSFISKLDDEPNDVGGMTSAQLKAEFDRAGNVIKEYINETLIPAVLDDEATAAVRAAAEAERVSNEAVRVANEQQRVADEQGRVAAEAARTVWEDYAAAKNYVPGNKVALNGSSYVNIKECVGVTPPNGEYWLLIARRGEDGGADLTLSNLADYNAARANIGAASNPNLLDNWYFADPVDQRCGYIAPLGVTFYNDTACTEVDIVNGIVLPAYYVNDTYGYVKTGANNTLTKYIKFSDMVRGYVGAGYTIDRWKLTQADTTIVKEDGCIALSGNGSTNCDWQQLIEHFEQYFDKTVTLSALLKDGTLLTRTGVFTKTESTSLTTVLSHLSTNGGIWLRRSATSCIVQLRGNANSTERYVAAKLELGDRQTLARQDADGNWVLNDPPPNKALELAKCQRYQWTPDFNTWFRISPVLWTDTQIDVFIPLPVSPRISPSTAAVMNLIGSDKLLILKDMIGGDMSDKIMRVQHVMATGNGINIRLSGSGFTTTPGYLEVNRIAGSRDTSLAFDFNL